MRPAPEPERQRDDELALDADLRDKFNGENPAYLPERRRNLPRDGRTMPGAGANPFPTLRSPESTPVPSCQLAGDRLVNLALKDQNGNVWEYRKDWRGARATGRLLLIDFWYSECPPCRAAMPLLVELHRVFHDHGLEVVGIAYEDGPFDKQVAVVNNVRTTYRIPYPTLLDDRINWVVSTRFGVRAFPTLFLLDENGAIVFRRQGFGDREFLDLAKEIYRRLH
jgi:thiol-disulfide isomerase/thioredoxin